MRAIDGAAVVYRDISVRTRLLGRVFRRRHQLDIDFDEVLAANAEPVTLPEPMVRTKVG